VNKYLYTIILKEWIMHSKSLERLFSLICTLSLVVWIVLPTGAWAASADLENTTTGSNSENRNEVSEEVERDYTANITETTSNRINFNLRTGNITATDNTTVGDVETGAINFTSAVTSTPSNATVLLPSLQTSGNTTTINAQNSETGSDSENRNTVRSTQSNDVTINHVKSVVNEVTVSAVTGDVVAARNTTIGSLTTGSINGSVAINTGSPGIPTVPTPPVSSVPTPISSPPNVITPTQASVPVQLAAARAVPAGVGGADIAISSPAQIMSSRFFPAGSSEHSNLLALAVLGLWIVALSIPKKQLMSAFQRIFPQ
jgi:hypothetical protein